MWIEHIDSILSQSSRNFDLVLSGCVISDGSKGSLINHIEGKKDLSGVDVFVDFIDELHPVNVTFNHSCIKCSKENDYSGYLFLSSDIKLTKENDLERMFKFHYENNLGISNFIVDNENWIPSHISTEYWARLQEEHSDFPFGLSINCDCMIFDRDIFKAYGKVIPDIFRSWCTESVFPFICASLNKKHTCHNNSLVVHHAIDRREGSSSIAKTGCEKGCDDLYRSSKTVWERLLNREAHECGFGYAECHFNIHRFTREHNLKMYLVHNSDAYISDYLPKDPQRLRNFISTAIYLTQEELDYDSIAHTFEKVSLI
jgi:hypothetical protein